MIVRATAHARFTTVLAAIAAILVVTTQLGCATLFGRDPGVDENGKKIVFTYDDWAEVLSKHVSGDGRVDYAALKGDRAALDRFTTALATHGPKTNSALFPTREDKLAYYLNAYNALAVLNVVNRYPLKAVNETKLAELDFFVATRLPLDSGEMNLVDIENKIIRAQFKDPRLRFAMTTPAMSAPPLGHSPYLPLTLGAQVESASKAFLHDRKNVAVEDGRLVLSNIFDWYKEDFLPSPIDWVRATVGDLVIPSAIEAFDVRHWDWSLNDSAAPEKPPGPPEPRDAHGTKEHGPSAKLPQNRPAPKPAIPPSMNQKPAGK